MKTIEEKAKAYDEALKQIKKCIPDENGFITIYPQEIFPELKESEDEKIRESLLEYLHTLPNHYTHSGVCVHEWITWLEKQDKKKYIPKYKIGDYVKNTNYKGEPIYEIVYMDKECYICEYRGKERMGDKAVMHFSFDNPYLRLVQNPTDAWSEKDEHWRQKAIDFMKHPDLIKATPTLAKDTIDWLKSLRSQL